MRTIKLADVVIQMHVRDEYSWQRVLYCIVRGLIVSIIMMPNVLTKIIINVIVVILFLLMVILIAKNIQRSK